jgi:hypothetical protein
LYYYRSLIPKGTLLSGESALIWAILGGLVFLNIADVSLLIRAIAFVPCLALAGIAFIGIVRPAMRTAEQTSQWMMS